MCDPLRQCTGDKRHTCAYWYYLTAINIPRYDHKLQIQSLLNYQF